jgi:hypothetical protein
MAVDQSGTIDGGVDQRRAAEREKNEGNKTKAMHAQEVVNLLTNQPNEWRANERAVRPSEV